MKPDATKLVANVKAARRVSTPLVAITTPDPGATIQAIVDNTPAKDIKIVWDCCLGLRAKNDETKEWINANTSDTGDNTIGNPVGLLTLIRKAPPKAIVFMHMASRFLGCPITIQGVWNLRDEFKSDGRMLVMLSPSIDLPAELQGDVVMFDEPLPDGAALEQIIKDTHEASEIELEAASMPLAVEAVQGLPAFQAEQVVAMSLSKKGLDVDAMWERKRRQIELTPGLKVHREGVKFKDIGGVKVIKQFLGQVLAGKSKPSAVVFIDEIEKMIAGSGGDTSGVSQDQLGTLLAYMQDNAATGMIFVGPPGSAKSMVAKAAGNEGGIPTIQLDLGGLKGSLIGQSEQQLRTGLKVITSVSNRRSLWIATCNSISELPPELRRRFTLGTFFFDLPDPDERAAIWRLHQDAYDLTDSELPNDAGWTGAEIRQCCDIAWRLGIPVDQAAKFVVPVSRSAADVIDRLRTAAGGKFLSASYPGVYQKPDPNAAALTKPGRRVASVEED